MSEHLTLEQTRARREGERSPFEGPFFVGNQYFKVYFGPVLISFSRVSNIQHKIEHEDFQEGGLNHYVHVLTKPNTQSGTITMEKGVAFEDVAAKLLRTGLLIPGRRLLMPVTITLYHRGEHGWLPARSWGVEDGMVTSCEVSELNGLGSEVTVERIEISHSGLIELL